MAGSSFFSLQEDINALQKHDTVHQVSTSDLFTYFFFSHFSYGNWLHQAVTRTENEVIAVSSAHYDFGTSYNY